MKTVTIRIRRNAKEALNEMAARFSKTWKSGKTDGDVLQFESPKALFRVLSPKRWELVECLQGLGPVSIRGLARELRRDVKRVHDDVRLLLDFGLVARTDEGTVHVPYDVIRADFDIRAAA
jgi:predicted transcriptional regulator